MIRYLTLREVLLIHRRMVERFGGSDGTRDTGLLESALARPRMSAFGEDAYPTLELKAAALFHSLIKNHPFVDGNKRTAFASMNLMLVINGRDLQSDSVEEIKMALEAASGKMDLEQIAVWIRKHSTDKAKH